MMRQSHTIQTAKERGCWAARCAVLRPPAGHGLGTGVGEESKDWCKWNVFYEMGNVQDKVGEVQGLKHELTFR